MDKKVLSQLQHLCARSEYSVSQIRLKALKRLDGDSDEAEEIVKSLTEEGYVNDLRYAGAFVREKSSLQGWGPIKIRFALRAKGISEADITEALEETDEEAYGKKLLKLIRSKASSLEGDPQIRLKLIKYALSRGYEYSQVESALKEL